ncbi:hypothetical protein [Mycoplasmopsis edwardii]|uniref:Uncharacterized protein n=1 Tax=Mycoplasmopsis edwardii TaxID=53558 RepID=A0ACD4PJ78_9BACT|nr:hypothetical protein [Mycoplasmopsis edwardii]WBP84213.1 hypothetical protein Me_995_000176 [Mycoplasmopsis edwardii]
MSSKTESHFYVSPDFGNYNKDINISSLKVFKNNRVVKKYQRFRKLICWSFKRSHWRKRFYWKCNGVYRENFNKKSNMNKLWSFCWVKDYFERINAFKNVNYRMANAWVSGVNKYKDSDRGNQYIVSRYFKNVNILWSDPQHQNFLNI